MKNIHFNGTKLVKGDIVSYNYDFPGVSITL